MGPVVVDRVHGRVVAQVGSKACRHGSGPNRPALPLQEEGPSCLSLAQDTEGVGVDGAKFVVVPEVSGRPSCWQLQCLALKVAKRQVDRTDVGCNSPVWKLLLGTSSVEGAGDFLIATGQCQSASYRAPRKCPSVRRNGQCASEFLGDVVID